MIVLWRLGLGSWVNFWPAVGGRVMVLVHVGRKTGKKRLTPVNYATIDDELYCIAAFGAGSDWYKNVLIHPEVEVWLPNGWWSGTATDVSDSGSRLGLLRKVLIASGFASYCAGIRPTKVSDAELSRRTADYRILRIKRHRALSPEGGPGDLSWIWPIVALVLLAVVLLA